jgi:hypothetical protein
MEISIDEARLTVLGRQLFPAKKRTVADILERAGFVRTLGGVDAYLSLRARAPGLTREAIDAAVAKSAAQVVPAVRGCIYLVARRDVGSCLRVAGDLTADRTAKELDKAGVKKGELAKVGKAVVAALAKGPLSTDAIKKALPEGVVRSLGEAGKKVGISSTLPPALRVLEQEGAIERTLVDGRLDSERYLWRKAAVNVFEDRDVRVPDTAPARFAAMAERYFDAAGLAPLAAFADWAGIPQKTARMAIEGLGLQPVTVAGQKGEWLLAKGAKPVAAAREAIAFLAFEDNVTATPGGPGLFIDAAHHDMRVPVWGKSSDERLGDARYLSLRPILADGRFVGFWEYEPTKRTVVTAMLGAIPAGLAKKIAAGADETAAFVRDELGHGRSFSLDTDEDLARRAKLVSGLSGSAPRRR